MVMVRREVVKVASASARAPSTIRALPEPLEKRILLVVLAVAFLVFAPSLGNGFALDDASFAQAVGPDGKPHQVIAGLKEPWWYFGQKYTAGSAAASFEYRPTTILSFALVYNLIAAPLLPANLEALPQHLFNVLVHVLAVFLVWRWLRDLGAGAFVALLAAGGFAVCGIHSESVAGIVGRADPMGMALGLSALRLFDRGRVAAAAFVFFLTFGAKESALAWAPFLVCHLLAKAWLAGEPLTLAQLLRTRGKALAIALGPPLVLFFVLRQVVVGDMAAYLPAYEHNPLAHTGAGPRVLTAVALLGFGLLKCVVPYGLSSIYGPGALPVLTSPLAPGFLAALGVLGAWLALALRLRRRQPLLFLGATVFLGFSFIGSNIPVAVGTIFGERGYYVPSLGVCLFAAWAVAKLREGSPARRAAVIALLALGVAHAAVILARNGAWRDSTTLLCTDADRTPASADLQVKAGYTLLGTDPARARAYFERAIAADPEHSGGFGNLAALLATQGDVEGAEANLRRALATKHVAHSGSQARLAEGLIRILQQRGKVEAAVTVCQETLAALPDHYYARVALLDLTLGRVAPETYTRMLDDAVRRYPTDPRFELRRGLFAHESGRLTPVELPGIAQRWLVLLGVLPAAEQVDATGVRARLYAGEILVGQGRAADARPVLEALLREPTLAPEVRSRAQAALGKIR